MKPDSRDIQYTPEYSVRVQNYLNSVWKNLQSEINQKVRIFLQIAAWSNRLRTASLSQSIHKLRLWRDLIFDIQISASRYKYWPAVARRPYTGL